MHVAIVRVELHIPQARSLKARRAAVRPVVDGLRSRFRVAVAEVGHADLWQRAAVGFAVVSATAAKAAEVADAAERWVWSHPELEVCAVERRLVGMDDDEGGALAALAPEAGEDR